MALSSGNKNEGSTLAEINITPLVDVMLVLLIIFMITAPMMMKQVDVKLPSANAQPVETKSEDVIVTLTKDGRLFFQNDSQANYAIAELPKKLSALFEGKERKEIFLRADAALPYGTVVEVIAACKNAGFEKVGMVTEPADQNQTNPL